MQWLYKQVPIIDHKLLDRLYVRCVKLCENKKKTYVCKTCLWNSNFESKVIGKEEL